MLISIIFAAFIFGGKWSNSDFFENSQILTKMSNVDRHTPSCPQTPAGGLSTWSCWWTTNISYLKISEGNVTTFAPRTAIKLIALGKLTFDERSVVRRVVFRGKRSLLTARPVLTLENAILNVFLKSFSSTGSQTEVNVENIDHPVVFRALLGTTGLRADPATK